MKVKAIQIKRYLEDKGISSKHLYVAVIILVIITAFLLLSFDNSDLSITSNQNSLDSNNEVSSENADVSIYVDISGEVKTPGVYQLKTGSRLFEVIEMAGGFTSKASVEEINQARTVEDGEKIIIPNNKSKGHTSQNQQDKININNANTSELQQINGIGPVTANKIIDYRNSIGKFKSIEEIKEVNGIGDKTFTKIKGEICI